MKLSRTLQRQKRHKRIRKHITGTEQRPRLCVFRSHTGFYIQAIDDVKGHTLAALKTKGASKVHGTEAGIQFAEILKKCKITTVVFDRAGYIFHGRIQSVADGIRQGGILF